MRVALSEESLGGRTDVVFPFLGKELGGSHISALTLALELERGTRFSPLFLCPSGTRLHEEIACRGLRVLSSSEPPVDAWPASHDLKRLLARRHILLRAARQGAMLVHCNDLPSLRSWLLPAKSLGIPLVYHHRSLNLMSAAKKLAISSADHVVCTSEATLRNVAFVPERMRSPILNPIDLGACRLERARCRAELKSALDLPDDAPLIGFVGNFWKRKRLFYFVDVACALRGAGLRAHFVIFGREGDVSRGEIESYIAAREMNEWVSFAGFRLAPLDNIAALDLLLAPAIEEPFGRTLIEANLVGTPYVATGDGGHSEIARRWGGGALVNKSASCLDFAAKALAVLEDPSAVVVPEALRAGIAEEFSAARHGDNLCAIYRTVLSRTAATFDISERERARAVSHDRHDRMSL